MKHVTFADKSLLMSDEAADLLLEYAALLANHGKADTVRLRAVGPDGNEVEATFLLDAGAPLMAETTSSNLPELDNSEGIAYLKEQIDLISSPPPVRPHDDVTHAGLEDLNF
jgi:hypothetical protein